MLVVGNVAWRVEVGEATAPPGLRLGGLHVFTRQQHAHGRNRRFTEHDGKMGKHHLAWFQNCRRPGAWPRGRHVERIGSSSIEFLLRCAVDDDRSALSPEVDLPLAPAGLPLLRHVLFGICLTIHQTLLCAAVGIEVAVAATQPRLGRDLFLGNSIVYVLG